MIPRIIHQIWEGKTGPLPNFLSKMAETWKEYHPLWQYEFWDGDRMEDFIEKHFPDFSETYYSYRYPVQRWDSIRYLILYKMGGMYVDFDCDCQASVEGHISDNGTCYFSMEPDRHCRMFGKDLCFNNALMLSPPGHPFFEYIITYLQTTNFTCTENKVLDVLTSTGPLMLTKLYDSYNSKSGINFFPPEQVSPWTKNEVTDYLNGNANMEKLEQKLDKAFAVHYFLGGWLSE